MPISDLIKSMVWYKDVWGKKSRFSDLKGWIEERSRLHSVQQVVRGAAEPDGSRRLSPSLPPRGHPLGPAPVAALMLTSTGEHAMRMMDCEHQTTSRMVALAEKPPSYRYQNIW